MIILLGEWSRDDRTKKASRDCRAEVTERRTGVIRISVEVDGDAGACFRTAVRAESIERAVGVASVRYPGSEVRVLFPIDPETFFCKDPTCAEETKPPKMPEATR